MSRKNRLIRDVYLAPDQDGKSAHTSVSGEAVNKAGRELRELGARVLGWWHSHANFAPFHSTTDDNNLETVLDQVAPTNHITVYKEFTYLDNDIKKTMAGDSKIYICDRNNTGRRLELMFSELKENPLAGTPMERIVVRLPIKISYAYSLVVNASGDPSHAEVATRYLCPCCSEGSYKARRVPIKAVDCESSLELDINKLRQEVKSKIILPKPILLVPRIFVRRGGRTFPYVPNVPPHTPFGIQAQTPGYVHPYRPVRVEVTDGDEPQEPTQTTAFAGSVVDDQLVGVEVKAQEKEAKEAGRGIISRFFKKKKQKKRHRR